MRHLAAEFTASSGDRVVYGEPGVFKILEEGSGIGVDSAVSPSPPEPSSGERVPLTLVHAGTRNCNQSRPSVLCPAVSQA